MIRRALSGLFSLFVLVVLGYLFFFVPLGERTLYDHVSRIAATPEAEELGRDAERASERLEEVVRERINTDASIETETETEESAEPTDPQN